MSKLAVNLSMLFTEVPLLQRFTLAKAHGFEHVEIQFPYELSVATLSQTLQQHQLSLCLINVPAGDLMQGGCGLAGVPGREAEFSAALDLAIDYATQLNVPSVNILAGRQSEGVALDACLDTLYANLRVASERLARAQIQPLIELINGINMPGFLLQTMAQGQHALDQVQHPALKLQYDCYHMAMMNENLSQCFLDNLEQIGHIQFADCPGRHQPDTGNIDFSDFFQTVINSPYRGFIAAEYQPLGHTEQSFTWQSGYFSMPDVR